MKLKGEVHSEQPAANEDSDRDIDKYEQLQQLVKDAIGIQDVGMEQVNIGSLSLYHQPSATYSPPIMEVICYFASYFILHPGVFLQNHKLNKI